MQQGHSLREITGAIYYEEIKDYTREAAWLVSLLITVIECLYWVFIFSKLKIGTESNKGFLWDLWIYLTSL